MVALANAAMALFGGGGVVIPFLDGALDWVGVSWPPREATEDADWSGDAGLEYRNDELDMAELSAEDVLLFCKWAIGNNGSGCLVLRRASLKKLVVAYMEWALFAAALPGALSPELASDLEDSDNRVDGSVNP